jgi:hypothetical protein
MVKVELGWVNVPADKVKGVAGIAREICKIQSLTWTNSKDVGNAMYNHTIEFMECYVQTLDGETVFIDSVNMEPANTINNWLKNQGGSIR